MMTLKEKIILFVIIVCGVLISFGGGLFFANVGSIKDYMVNDFFPRKPYPTFFIDERGLKNPMIYDIHIQNSCLYVKAIGDGGKIANDIVVLDIRRITK